MQMFSDNYVDMFSECNVNIFVYIQNIHEAHSMNNKSS